MYGGCRPATAACCSAATGTSATCCPNGFVRSAFQIILRRDPDPGGLANWSRRCSSRRSSPRRGSRRAITSMELRRRPVSEHPPSACFAVRLRAHAPECGAHPRSRWDRSGRRRRCARLDGIPVPVRAVDDHRSSRRRAARAVRLHGVVGHGGFAAGPCSTATTGWSISPPISTRRSSSCSAGRRSSTSPRTKRRRCWPRCGARAVPGGWFCSIRRTVAPRSSSSAPMSCRTPTTSSSTRTSISPGCCVTRVSMSSAHGPAGRRVVGQGGI